MVDHLDHAARQRLRGERKCAQHDETHVRHRRIGDESLQVGLHRRRDRTVDDADDGEGEPERSTPERRFGEQVQPETQQAIGAEFQHHPGQHDRSGGGRLRVGVRQPGVQRHQRHLHRERNGEREEQPSSGRRSEVRSFGDLDEVEGGVTEVLAGDRHRRNEPDQHEGRAEHREQEELGGRVDPLLVPPTGDEEVHRHEHDLEEDEEHEQVEAEEAAHHARLQQQQPSEVRLLIVVRVDADDGKREQHAGEHHEEQRDAVDAEVPRDTPRLDPRVLRDELEAGVAGLERRHQPHRHRQRAHGGQQRDDLGELGPCLRHEHDEQRADHRHEDQCGEDRERNRSRFGCQHHRIPRITTNHPSSSTTPMPMMPAY